MKTKKMLKHFKHTNASAIVSLADKPVYLIHDLTILAVIVFA
jgi:hypothetical protein